MSSGDLTYLFFDFLLSVIIVCVCIYCVFVKKRIVKWEDASDSKKQWMKEHESRINKIIACCMIGTVILFAEGSVIPYIRDIPYIMREEYMIAKGRAENQDHGGRDEEEKRTVQVILEDGDKVELKFFDDYVDEGEELTVAYLPHSKFGTRINRRDEGLDVAPLVAEEKREMSGWECLLYAMGMPLAFMLVYRYDKKHSKPAKETADRYVIMVPAILKQVYMLVFAAGMMLYGIFSILYLKKLGGVTEGHLALGAVLASIGIVATFLASKWKVEVSGEKLKVSPWFRRTISVSTSEIERAKTGSKDELMVFYKGKKLVTVDRLCINYDKLRDTLVRCNKLHV